MNNPNTKNILLGIGVVGSIYLAYAYGQKNPERNFMDVPP
jgi:hypothetical protein